MLNNIVMVYGKAKGIEYEYVNKIYMYYTWIQQK